MPESETGVKRFKAALYWIAATIAFAIIHNKSPLYNSNETTKLLHGLALGGRGDLGADWFAGTVDPLPFFSWFIAFTYRYLGETFFYVYYAALLGVFLYAVYGIFSSIDGIDRTKARIAAFLAIVAFLFSRFFRETELRLAHFSLYSFVTGVADQYLINPLFQNSLFGVFLVLSVALFLRKRPFLAATCLALAATLHSAYLFGAAALTLAYMIRMLREGRDWKKPLLLGAFTLLLVLPTVILGYGSSAIADDEGAADQVLSIIVNERIPHHSLPSVWLNGAAWLKIAIVAAAVLVNRRNALFETLLVPFALGALGTIAQIATGSLALALIAPWRVSVFLVPLATLSLASAALRLAFDRWQSLEGGRGRAVFLASAALIALCLAGGAYTQMKSFEAASRSPARQLAARVDASRSPGDTYLVDPRDGELDAFRILAGAPIVVNWKSHPYRDDEVLEWKERIADASAFYGAASGAEAKSALSKLREQYRITHIVVRAGGPAWIARLGLEKSYENSRYSLYRLPARADSAAVK